MNFFLKKFCPSSRTLIRHKNKNRYYLNINKWSNRKVCTVSTSFYYKMAFRKTNRYFSCKLPPPSFVFVTQSQIFILPLFLPVTFQAQIQSSVSVLQIITLFISRYQVERSNGRGKNKITHSSCLEK